MGAVIVVILYSVFIAWIGIKVIKSDLKDK